MERYDQRQGLSEWRARLEQAADGPTALRLWATMQAERNPKIGPLARALETELTAEAATALTTRLDNRTRFARQLVDRLASAGVVDDGWDRDLAATLLWTLTSFGVWDDLVNHAGLSPDQYIDLVTTSAINALAQPSTEQRRRRKVGARGVM